MPTLTKEDWAEIYYAVLQKIDTPSVQRNRKWTAQLRDIINKIGPDGKNMYREAA